MKALRCPMASGRVDVAGRFVEVETMSLASSATLAESSIDILLWNFPLKSHFADAAEAQPQAPPVQSSEIARHPSCRRRSPAPLPSCSWTCPRRRAQPISDILRLPALPNGTPGFGHFVRIDRRIAPDGRRRLCQIAVSMTPGMDRADPDAIA